MPDIKLADQVTEKNTFDRVVCWRSEDTREILDIEATRSSDAVFMATHSPVAMRRREQHDRDASTAYNENQFLDDFLDVQEPFRFIPVLGKTGVGKSHLVRWLDIQIRQRDDDVDREVLLVEKAGSNLRTVLERILSMSAAEGDAFDEYRERLEKAAEDIAEGELKERILVELRFAVQNYDAVRMDADRDRDRGQQDTKGYVAEILPDILEDPYFRDEWLADEGVIARTHERSFKNTNQHDRPSFDVDGLPLDKSQVEVQRHAPSASSSYRKLDREDFQEAAVDVLNECLGKAVGRLLNFKGDDLLQLMLDIRREFNRRGVELVLLIEDIAAVQGLDRQLLASLERSGEDLGVLRTAMGCTDGYFDSNIPNTTKDRSSFLLNLDVKDREEIDLATFAARYLNAIRVGQDQLEVTLNGDGSVPSACAACTFSETCHAAFGSRNGREGEDAMGLYPFTEAALETLYQGISDQAFNPRQLIMNVLRAVLVNYTDDLEQGHFPPNEIKETYRFQQGLSVDALTQQDWKKDDPERVDQRILLADTWGRAKNGEDLSPVVFKAFGLDIDTVVTETTSTPEPETVAPEAISDDPSESEPTDQEPTDQNAPDPELTGPKAAAPEPTESKPSQPDPTPEPPAMTREEKLLNDREEKLNQWAQEGSQGSKMPQSLVQKLRSLVHESVVQRIDWDAEGLSESFFAGRTRTEFCKTSIDFNGGDTEQDVRSKNRRIQLQLPFEDQDPVEVRIALEGLLRMQHYGNWSFERGREYLLQVSSSLDVWAEHVLDQIRQPTRGKPVWSPAPAAAELLAVRARLAGVDMGTDVPLEKRVDALFRSYTFSTEDRGRAWDKIVTELDDLREDLIEILEAHAWLRKGTGAFTRVYDVAQFESVLSSLDEHEALQAPFEASSQDELRKEYRPLWSARQVVGRYLTRAVQEEVKTLQSWMSGIDDAFSDEMSLADQVDQVTETIFETRDVSRRTLFSARDLTTYERLAEKVRDDRFWTVVASVRDVLDTADETSHPGPVLSGLGQDRSRPMEILSAYIESAESILQDVQTGLQSDIETREQGEGELDDTFEAIRSNLQALQDGLTTIRDIDLLSTAETDA